MARYAEERKEAVIARLSPPENRSPREVADMEGISLATVYNWQRQAREQGRCLPDADVTGPRGWTARDKFAAVVEAAALNEHDRAAYCRRRGLHMEQLQAWRRDCEQAADLGNAQRCEQAAGDRAQRQRIKALERELQRKEAALAETAALLTLSKKARAIWGGRGALSVNLTADSRAFVFCITKGRDTGVCDRERIERSRNRTDAGAPHAPAILGH